MKYATLALMGIGLAFGSSTAHGQAPTPKGEPEMKTVEQKYAYMIGLDIGQRMKAGELNLDADFIAKGIKDALADKPALNEAQMAEVMKAFQAARMANDPVTKASIDFLAANKNKPGVTALPNGLQYKVIKAGSGKIPKVGETVVVNYRGTLIDGTEFDSSYKRSMPFEFDLGGQVIKGWNEIIQKMKVGDKWEVYIPADLAYGANPRRGGPIRPNDALIFEIELLQVK